MIKWMRPSGNPIELADTENLNEFAKAQGWKRDKPKVEEVIKPKRTRRNKVQMQAYREALEHGDGSSSN